MIGRDALSVLLAIQGPHGGSALAHDLANTTVQRSVALNMLLERLLRGCRHAVLDLSFSARQVYTLQLACQSAIRIPTLQYASFACHRSS